MDLDFDAMFVDFSLPSLFCGSLDFSKTVLMCSQDGYKLGEFMRKLSSTGEDETVRQVLMRANRLGHLDANSLQYTLCAFASFKNLYVANIQKCGLGADSMAMLVSNILSLPCMQGTASQYPFVLSKKDGTLVADGTIQPATIRSELNLKDNRLDDDWFRSLALLNGKKLKNNPANGVSKLVLSDNLLRDGCLSRIVTVFPQLRELHFSGNTGMDGHLMRDVISVHLAGIELLGLDRTSVSANGLMALRDGLRARATNTTSGPIRPLELWLRGTVDPVDDSWLELMDCCSDPKYNKAFTMKHDLQVRSVGRRVGEVQKHDDMVVKVWIDGMHPVQVIHPETLAVQPTVKLADTVLKMVTSISLDGVNAYMEYKERKKSNKKWVLQDNYVEAFKTIIERGLIKNTYFKIEAARLVNINRFTKEEIAVDGMSHAILGSVVPGWSFQFDVVLAVDTKPTVPVAKAPRGR